MEEGLTTATEHTEHAPARDEAYEAQLAKLVANRERVMSLKRPPPPPGVGRLPVAIELSGDDGLARETNGTEPGRPPRPGRKRTPRCGFPTGSASDHFYAQDTAPATPAGNAKASADEPDDVLPPSAAPGSATGDSDWSYHATPRRRKWFERSINDTFPRSAMDDMRSGSASRA